MSIDPWTLVLQLLNVLVLIWLLSRFLFRPISEAIDARRVAVAAELDAASDSRQQAEADAAHVRKSLDSIDAQGKARLEANDVEVRTQRERLLDAARRDIATQAESAREASRLDRRKQLADIEEEAGEFALDIARRLLERLPDSVQVDGFIDDLALAAAGLPGALDAHDDPAGMAFRLIAPRPLTAAESAHLQHAFRKALGSDVEFQTRVDASLVAGLELEWPHGAVRNSFRSDLARIATTLRPESHARI